MKVLGVVSSRFAADEVLADAAALAALSGGELQRFEVSDIAGLGEVEPDDIGAVVLPHDTPSTQLAASARLNVPVLLCGECALPAASPRVLIPLEGAAASADTVSYQLRHLFPVDVELVVLHVFTWDTLPPVLDHPVRDVEMWAAEFSRRYFPDATNVETRIALKGSIGQTIATFGVESRCDLIVLTWSRNSSAGHATVVRDVIARSPVPVLLLPADVTESAPRR